MKKWFVVFLVCFFAFSATAVAAEESSNVQNQIQESLFSEFDFSEVDKMLNEIFPEERLDFFELVTGTISGELDVSMELIKELIWNQFLYSF